MHITPYVTFNGNCAEAFKWYAEILGGEIVFMEPFRNSPIATDMPEEALDQVMHARLKIGEGTLMASDNPWANYSPPSGIHISTSFTNLEEATRVFNALAEDGEIKMKFEKTFWTVGFGVVVDRFGVPWMVNCETSGD